MGELALWAILASAPQKVAANGLLLLLGFLITVFAVGRGVMKKLARASGALPREELLAYFGGLHAARS